MSFSASHLFFFSGLLAIHNQLVAGWHLQGRIIRTHHGAYSSLLFSKKQPINEEEESSSLEDFLLNEFDDSMMIMDNDDFMTFDSDGPDVFLNEEDLSQLYYDYDEIDSNSTLPATLNISSPSPSLSFVTSELSYFYLRDELGLSEDVMWKITNEAGSVLGMKATTVKTKVAVLRRAMNLTDNDIRQLISSFPPLLHLGAKTNLSPTILVLLRRLDLARKELKAIVMGCPAILGYSIANLHRKISFLTDTMGYSIDQSRKILLQEPSILKSSVSALLSRYRFLIKEIQIPPDTVRKIVQKNPKILMMSVDKNLQPKIIFYFIMTLYMEPKEVHGLLLSYPLVLNYNLDNHIQPITRYFLSLDFSAFEFARMLLRFPRLLTYSLAKMKRVVGYLRFELGLQAHDVRRVLYQAPQVISLTMEDLQCKIEFLLNAAKAPGQQVDKSTEDSYSTRRKILRKLIVGMPALLHLSVDKNLRPKVEYLQSILGQEELSDALKRFPTLLGYSLDNRIKPRLEQILAVGIDGGKLTVGLPMKQENFEKWLKRRAQKLAVVKDSSGNVTSAAKKGILVSKSSVKTEVEKKRDKKGRIVQKEGRVVHWVRRS